MNLDGEDEWSGHILSIDCFYLKMIGARREFAEGDDILTRLQGYPTAFVDTIGIDGIILVIESER
jgi:hypothetical protein